ncbi:hypothetical protein N9L74_06890 [Luminiphilus sp.]|nr:hypothetical protein [Luminiphilus sp.]
MSRFEGKTVVVTGAASGIGEATASKVNEKDLQDQQCEYSPQALPEPTSTISCLHDRFLDGPLLPTPHLYFLYFA